MAEVSIILPTYDEPETAPAIIAALFDFAFDSDLDGEIIVVDDSPDNRTATAIESDHGGDARVRVVSREETGLASAVLRGFDEATNDICVVMDADGQHPVHRVRDLATAINAGADMAIGSRFTSGGGIDDGWPAHRKLMNAGASTLARVAIPPARELTDPMSGMFAVDRSVVDAARDDLRPTGFKVLLEVLARCPVHEIHEVGIQFAPRAAGSSNLSLGEIASFARHCGRLARPARRPAIKVRRPTEAV